VAQHATPWHSMTQRGKAWHSMPGHAYLHDVRAQLLVQHEVETVHGKEAWCSMCVAIADSLLNKNKSVRKEKKRKEKKRKEKKRKEKKRKEKKIKEKKRKEKKRKD